MTTPVASIVIPVYNSEAYIERCIQSARNQTCSDIEILCVDNGSTDASVRIISQLALEDQRIHLIEEPAPGVSRARNAGVSRASGRYIAFMDSDDTMEPNLIEKAVCAAERHQAQMVIYSFDECYENPDIAIPWPRCPQEELYELPFRIAEVTITSRQIVTPNVWRILFSAAFLQERSIVFDEDLSTSEDLLYVYQALLSASRIALIPDVLYHYRKDNLGSLTHSDRGVAGSQALMKLLLWFSPEVRSQQWFRFQLSNFVLETFQYQLGSSASLEEFLSLFRAYLSDWQPYIEDNRGYITSDYDNFLERMAGQDPYAFLYSQYALTRTKYEQSNVYLHWERSQSWNHLEQARALQNHIAGIETSKTWRILRKLAKVKQRLSFNKE